MLMISDSACLLCLSCNRLVLQAVPVCLARQAELTSAGQTSWVPPQGVFIVPRQPEGEWWELADKTRNNRSYFYNTLTRDTQWTRPGENQFVIPLGLIQVSSQWVLLPAGADECRAVPPQRGMRSVADTFLPARQSTSSLMTLHHPLSEGDISPTLLIPPPGRLDPYHPPCPDARSSAQPSQARRPFGSLRVILTQAVTLYLLPTP